MRLEAITFDGYSSGQTDFGTLITTAPQSRRDVLLDVVQVITGQVTNPVPNLFISVIIVGHSDRQDRVDLDCDQKRKSEIETARERAVSTWEWIKLQVISNAAQAGFQVNDWWESSPHVKWGLVYAAAGMLQRDPPADENDRKLNRRVVVLVSIFNPE